MARVNRNRIVPAITPPFVVFLFGIRINNYLKIYDWWPVVRSLKRLMRSLSVDKDQGFLGYEYWSGNPCLFIQYWRSFEALQSYARDKQQDHFPVWLNFNENVSQTGTVGLWHEAYLIERDCFEAVYKNMPLFGLAKAGGATEMKGSKIGR